jgi:hypothetical protein
MQSIERRKIIDFDQYKVNILANIWYAIKC